MGGPFSSGDRSAHTQTATLARYYTPSLITHDGRPAGRGWQCKVRYGRRVRRILANIMGLGSRRSGRAASDRFFVWPLESRSFVVRSCRVCFG